MYFCSLLEVEETSVIDEAHSMLKYFKDRTFKNHNGKLMLMLVKGECVRLGSLTDPLFGLTEVRSTQSRKSQL